MNMPTLFTLPGSHVQVVAPVADLDFFDTQSVKLPRSVTPLEAWSILMSRPSPLLRLAFGIRDAISSKFGVKRIGGFSGKSVQDTSIGEKLDFFLVENISANVLSLSERDKHLDVLTCISTSGTDLAITSSVKTHNAFGTVYMIPVAPAHKLIVRSYLKRLKKELS